MNPTLKTPPVPGPDHDKSFRNAAPAAPHLFRLRQRIHLRPVRDMLVRRRNRAPADAGRGRRLPVPELPAEDDGATRRFAVMTRATFCYSPDAAQREALRC
jgi:hypothetical protein